MNFKITTFKSFLAALSVIFLILVSDAVNAQSYSGKLTAITEKDGLSSNNVSRVLVDNQGYVWISTYNGPVRYDGYEFKKFYSNPNDPTAIRGMIAYSLFQDHNKSIWVGTNPSYVEKYNPAARTFHAFDYSYLIDPLLEQRPLYGYVVSSINEDNNGRLYFGINANVGEPLPIGLLYKDAGNDSVKIYKTIDGQVIRSVFRIKKDPDGNIWVLSYSGIFIIKPDGHVKQFPFSNLGPQGDSRYIADFVFAGNGHAWFLLDDLKLIDYTIASQKYTVWKSPYDKTPDGNQRNGQAIFVDKYENLWIGTTSGIQIFNTKTDEFSLLDKGFFKEQDNASISSFSRGDFGDLWISTYNNGLLHYENKPRFVSYTNNSSGENALMPGWAAIIYEAHDGKIWISSQGGISVLDTLNNTIEQIPFSKLPDEIQYLSALWENSPGEFYVAADHKLFSYSVKTNKAKKITLPGLPEEIMITNHQIDSHGNEWICSRSGLFRREKNASQFRKYDISHLVGSDVSSIDITGVFESKKNGLWIFTNNGLFLYHYNTDKIDRHGYDKTKGDVFLSQDINSLYEDPEGMVWVGGWQGGLSKYNPQTGKIKTYTGNDGLPSMSVQSIIGDEINGTLWLSTFNGLSRFDPKTEQFNNFSIDDGIQGALFADGSFLKTSTGRFIFGGANGITIFNPSDFNIKYDPPKVFLTDLKLFNKSIIPGVDAILKKPVSETKSIELKYDQNNLTIDYIGIHYSNPAKNRYAYKLENYDNAWREVGTQNEAFYPNLPPGKYEFRVKAANDNGVWNEQGARLQITVDSPWWAKWWAFVIYGLLIILVAFRLHRYLQNRVIRQEREKAQEKELAQAKEIEKAYLDLGKAHETLKSTQSQLIQSEKMASLGELTAGIAHEIQNPLNFVNNFSEVNSELADELKSELATGNLQLANEIASDIKDNSEKINHHGKRADAIVKGMLEHSRTSTGVKEPTDINTLADEYLRLAYQSFKAKDKKFNAIMKTDFDGSIDKINIIPQDIGRVLLNLFNNAFYAVNQQKSRNLNSYEPKVAVSTKKSGNSVMITVSDNGGGIPENIKEKIFQPFFTTKPTGSGTGLGLSLSYDIVKAHGGEIKVETPPAGDTGTSFMILLPIQNIK